MLLDLFSTSNYTSFNIKLAEILGLQASIYLSEITNVNEKACRKNKISDDGFFKPDRRYMTSRTTLTAKEQKEVEKLLMSWDILEVKEDTVKLNLDNLTSLMLDSNENLTKDLSAVIKPKTKRSKSECILENLKTGIFTTNEELRKAYCDWVDAVYAKQGWMSKKSITSAQTLIDNISNHDLDIALHIIEIASINGYRDMQWAVNVYQKEPKKLSTTPAVNFKDIEFIGDVF